MVAPLPPLAEPADVTDVWRTLTSDEEDRAFNLIGKASVLLRQTCPWVDERILAYVMDPTDPRGLPPELVATVVATVVKRFLSNVQGIASESVGQYSMSYALRGDKGVRGDLEFLPSDLAKLAVSSLSKTRLMTIRVKAAAPDAGGQDSSTLDVFVPGDPNGNWVFAAGDGGV